ncbi:hypothetical protein PABG_01269 [Paracoccidioides brasiliensis Pb03]|nr:hypothetical protein PABG_01269 [Paracoccidioides brasiliensis Pb03]
MMSSSSFVSSVFPTYLLHSIPFRKRDVKTTKNTNSTPSDSETPSKPQSPAPSSNDAATNGSGFLHGHKSYLRCARCSAELCLTSQIISKGFTGRHGRAYLVSANPSTDEISISPSSTLQRTSLPNTVTQQPLPRQLVTGAHTVSDITCRFCGSLLGWKYVAAEEDSQKYKIGKFILETKGISICSSWEEGSNSNDCYHDNGDVFGCFCSHRSSGSSSAIQSNGSGNDVEFDSQDEEECEDLFSGIWSPWLAERRRRDRNFERHSLVK